MIATEPTRWWEEVSKRFECKHEQVQLVRYQQSNGQWRIRRQCCNCGEYTTSDLPQRNVAVMSLPVANKSLQENYRAARNKASEDARQEYLDQTQRNRLAEQQRWADNYNAYLRSDHWKQLRRIVLQRDNNRCQNCFSPISETSAHIHHLSYVGLDRVGKSFAFECVALCRNCHISYHPRMQE